MFQNEGCLSSYDYFVICTTIYCYSWLVKDPAPYIFVLELFKYRLIWMFSSNIMVTWKYSSFALAKLHTNANSAVNNLVIHNSVGPVS